MKIRIFRLGIGTLAMALIIAALCKPPAVQGVNPLFVNAPTNLTVTGTTNTTISLSWTPVPGINSYWLERAESMSGPFLLAGNAFNTTVITDFGLDPARAYVYRLRANNGSDFSAPSNMAVGTTVTFEFTQLQNQRIKAQHLHDVRTAINSVRRVANLPAAIWARDPLNNLLVRGSDVQEARNRLDEALAVLQIPVLGYQDPVLSTGANGTPVRAAHLEQLQLRSTRGSSNSSDPLYSTNLSRAKVGEFAAPVNLPLVTVHLSVLPNRKVLFWGRDLVRDANGNIVTVTPGGNSKQVTGHSDAWLWDPVTDIRQQVNNPTTNLFCSGHSFLPDGRLIVTGGHGHSDFDGAGEKHINIFDYTNNSNPWSRNPNQDMNLGRWYPYNVTLSSGEPMVISGFYNDTGTAGNHQTNLIPQVLTSAGTLKNLSQPTTISNYPYIYVMPDGKVLQAQSGFGSQDSRLFDPRATQGRGSWCDSGTMLSPHAFGTSVLYDSGRKALVVGGLDNSQQPLANAEYIDLLTAQCQPEPFQQPWTSTDSMRFARVYPTATILPDGKVLVTGGVGCKGSNNIESYEGGVPTCSGGQVLNPELWDPDTGKWTIMAPHTEIRAYHSVAALLPDARVLVSGGGLPGAIGEIGIFGTKITDPNTLLQPNSMGVSHTKAEIFSPPYLFDANGNLAARPSITSWPPTGVTNGETFFVGVSGAGSQPRVSLVRLPSVTHAFNQDQRQITLDTPIPASGGFWVTAPNSPNQCPPGIYMMFVLNSAGVPSIAQFITIKNSVLLPNDIPETTATGGGQTWEQGIEFSSAVPGQITHVRFYKAAAEPSGGHVGRIWNAVTGDLLAWAPFVNETAEGWQEAQLPTPLPIVAGVRYKVTYNVNNAGAKTFNVLDYPILSWPLTGWGSSFSTPAGSFPTTGSTSNLFADVRFK